jgi:hypothetical protein
MRELWVENSDSVPHHVLDPTTPWYEFLSYIECCRSLNPPGHPSLTRFMRYHEYLKEVGLK